MAAILLATALLASPSATSFAVGARPLIEVESLAGDILIEAGAPGEVRVEARVNGGGFQAAAEPTAGGVRVQAVCGARLQPGYARCGRGEVRLSLRVPPDAEVRVSAVRGDVLVRNVVGPLTLETMVGDVRVSGAGPDVTVSTESGEANVDRAEEQHSAIAALVRGPARVLLRALSALSAWL